MTPGTWREMVDRSMELFNALGDGEKRIEENEKEAAVVQRRALVLRRDMKQGEVITEGDLFPLRPIPKDGIPPYEANTVVGKRLRHSVKEDQYLRRDDFE